MKHFFLFAFAATMILAASCSPKSGASSTSSANDSTSTSADGQDYNGKIAFIRMDSLMSAYGLFIDLNDEFNQKQTKAQKELTAKGRGLEREMMDYQDKAQKGLITRYQASTIEEGLQKKQQDIAAYRDRILGQLSEEQNVMSAKISKVILDYLNELNKEKKYSLILQTMGGNPVIIADPSLDITNDVLLELNSRYQDSLAKNTK